MLKLSHSFNQPRHLALTYVPVLAVVILVAIVGIKLLTAGHAQTPSAGVSAASGTVTAPATIQANSTATNGHDVQFGSSSSNPTPPSNSFNVVGYGADSSGRKDSTLAIRQAITAAEAATQTSDIATVYFPAGTYLLNDPDGKEYDFDITKPVNILGAGQTETTILEAVGTNDYPATSLYDKYDRGKTIFNFGSGASGFYLSGLTLNAQKYNAGDTIDNWASNSIIENSTILGGYNGTGQNGDVAGTTVNYSFINDLGMRDIQICSGGTSMTPPTGYATNNVVRNMTLYGQGVGGNADLDVTCQKNITISNITDNGWGIALYSDANVTLSGYNYTPWNLATENTGPLLTSTPISLTKPTLTPKAGCQIYFCNAGLYVTSALTATIYNFTTSGAGGTLVGQGDNKGNNQPNQKVTINNEQMTSPGFKLTLTDAADTTINASTLDGIGLSGPGFVDGLTVSSDSHVTNGLSCPAEYAATVTNLSGISCN